MSGHYYIEMTDLQQLPPAGWCPVCRREIYAEGKNLCTRCEEAEESEDV